MAGRALDVARIQRVVNTCWLSESLGQLPASAQRRGERGRDRQTEAGVEREKEIVCVCVCVCVFEGKSVPSQRSSVPSAVN